MFSVWCAGEGRRVDHWAGGCALEAGDCGAASLRNRDAGDSDARYFAEGHLEQEIQHLEGFAVPACQWSGGVHGVIFSVRLDRQVGSRGGSIR